MKKILVLAISVIFGMSMFFTYAVPAMAGDDMGISESCPMPSISGASQYTFGASHYSGYMGAVAVDRQYNELGRVVAVLDNGSDNENYVDFLVVSSCLPGMDHKLVAVPVNAIEIHRPVGTVVTNVTQDEFEKAPAISSEGWEGMGSGYSKWVQDDYNYFEKTF